jgi:hypothetical protein
MEPSRLPNQQKILTMNNPIYQVVPAARPSFLQRLFKQQPPENAIIELNNLLAAGILSVRQEQLRDIENNYKVSFASDFELNLQEFYAVYWNYYLKQTSVNDNIVRELAHLVRLFNLSEEIITVLQTKIGKVWFEAAAKASLVKRQLTLEDEYGLEQFRLKLKLDQQTADGILGAAKLDTFEQYTRQVISKKRCTPDEEAEVLNIINSLKIPESKTRPAVDEIKKFKYYWELENLPLKVIPNDPSLQKSEICYFKSGQVQWHEIRGSGSYKQYELINQGTLFLTNKRLVFAGNAKNSVITYDKISRISVDAKGATVFKDKGKDPVLTFSGDKVIFEIVFKRILRDFR